jgi:hypothetical protein
MSNKNKYILKYGQNNELYNYIELNKGNKVISYFKLKNDNKLIRYDRHSNKKELIKFKNNVKLKQKFMAGESFISVFDVKKDECLQYNMPEKEKSITLIGDNITSSNYGEYVVNFWERIQNKSKNLKEKNIIKTSNNIINKFPISLTGTINAIISSRLNALDVGSRMR